VSEPTAEVFVLVRPDLTKFRAELEAELRALGTKGINIPVNVGGPTTARQAGAIQAQVAGIGTAASRAVHPLDATAAAIRNLGVSTGQTVRVSGDYVAVAQTLPPTLRQQAIASEQAARAANDLLLAEKGLTRANVEMAATAKSSGTALKAEAAAAVAAAGRISTFQRGIASTAASLLGLRGATLAASAPFLAGAVAITVFAKAIGQAVSFDRELNVLQATTAATADEMKRAGAEARALGRDINLPGVSAQDAAQSITELAKAGLDLEQAMDGARGALELATAANIDNAQAVELVASALNAFQLPGNEAVHVADSLANAANNAQGSIVDIGIALHQSAAVAHQAGLSFSTTVTFLTALARAGLSSSDAGTSLRTAILRLINPVGKARDVLKSLNIELRDQAGNIRPDVFAQIGNAIRGMTRAQQDATLAILGGQDAIRSFAILSQLSADEVAALTAEIDKQGTALNLAASRTKGLAGAGEQLKNNATELGITIGHVLSPALKEAADNANILLSDLIDLIDVAKQGINPIKGLSDSLGVTGVAAKALKFGFLASVSGAVAAVEAYRLLTKSSQEVEQQGGLTAASFRNLQGPIDFVRRGLLGAAEAFTFASQEARSFDGVTLTHITGELNNLLEKLLDVQIAGGTLSQQLAVLAEARIQAEKAVQAITAQPGQANKGVAEQRRAAKEQLLDIANRQKQINEQIKTNAEKAAADRKAAAQAAQKKLDEADQALLAALGLRRGGIENKLAQAGLTTSLQDDIRFQRALTEELKRERAIVQRNIHDEQLKAQQTQQLTAAIISSESATRQLIVQQRAEAKAREEARKERVRERRDRAQESRELDVQIAQAKDNQRQELTAHQALLKYLIQRRQHSTKGSLEYKRLTLEIEQERKAIRELNEAQKKLTDDFKALQFEFLQTQQGFASNLLSNILPTATFAGTVGGGGISTTTGGTTPVIPG
jgi:TP901 family phage tail tape measure protein